MEIIVKNCVKKTYSAAQAEQEVAKLKKSNPSWRWAYYFCDECKSFHVKREK